MPPADKVKNEGEAVLAHVLVYGKERTKKTWWALQAGECGFNILYADGENSRNVIRNIDNKHLQRTLILDLKDELDRPIFSVFMTYLLKGNYFCWDEQAKEARFPGQPLNPLNSHVAIDGTKFTSNDLFIPDSYTALAESVRAQDTMALGIDLSSGEAAIDAREDGGSRKMYQADGTALSWQIKQMRGLKCHLCLIGHASVYELYDPKDKKRKNGPIAVHTQIASSSGPHGMLVGKNFSDILRFEMLGTGYRISTEAHETKSGGCRAIEPKVFNWDELQFKEYARLSGIKLPVEPVPPSEAFRYYPPGEIPENWMSYKGPTGNAVLAQAAGGTKLSLKDLMGR